MDAEQLDRFARHFRAINVIFCHEFAPLRYPLESHPAYPVVRSILMNFSRFAQAFSGSR
jgi:hypothetical protein